MIRKINTLFPTAGAPLESSTTRLWWMNRWTAGGILWDEKYRDNILMQDSVRDAFGVALRYLGYSLNSTDLDELTEARDLLIEQKPLVQAYVIDQVRDKMIGNEAANRRDLFPARRSIPRRKILIWNMWFRKRARTSGSIPG